VKNPYRYTGPLDPIKDKIVLIPRKEELKIVSRGIRNGDYWAILGPREIGKTTFLRQVASRFKNSYHLYFNLEVSPSTEEYFYQWLMDEFSYQIPSEQIKIKKGKKQDPKHRFLRLLESFNPGEKKGVLFLFDGIEGLPYAADFLKLWRTIYHNRYHKKELNKYSVIIAGSAELFSLTTELNAPFNIAEKFYIKDFSREESEQLIDKPFEKLNIRIETKAKEKLISQIAGHPKMFQETCFNLVKIAIKEKRTIIEKDVDAVIERLFVESSTFDGVRRILKEDEKLSNLIKAIIKGSSRKFHIYKEFAIKGLGPIIEDESSRCAIRNEVFKSFFGDYLNIEEDETRFQTLKKVGDGGMGVVYKAKDSLLERTVAIKKISSELTRDKANLEDFYKEARTSARLRHPNIVRVYDIKQIKNDYFIIMEFINGMDYKKIIDTRSPLSLEEILLVGKKLFSALDFSHSKGIIHGDIKPQNIMKDRYNEIKILDFGIAVLGEGDKSKETEYIMASPYYISPEQIRGEKVDHLTDIYSAGVTLFHLTTGIVPFDGETFGEILLRHLNESVPQIKQLRPETPDELVKIIEKCMQKTREDRYQSAEDVLKQIEPIEKTIRNQNSK
jgi:tRNA A-37 threonylcarbamoyl transferase component Bud32